MKFFVKIWNVGQQFKCGSKPILFVNKKQILLQTWNCGPKKIEKQRPKSSNPTIFWYKNYKITF